MCTGGVTAKSPAPGGDEGPLQWARDAQTGMTGKGQQTHLHQQPLQQGGDGHGLGLTHTSGTGHEHPPPASARRPSMLIAVNQPVRTDTLAGTRSSSPPHPGEQKHSGEPSSELNTTNKDAKEAFFLCLLLLPGLSRTSQSLSTRPGSAERRHLSPPAQPALAWDASVFMPCPLVLNLRALGILKLSCPGHKQSFSHLRSNLRLGKLDFSSTARALPKYSQI